MSARAGMDRRGFVRVGAVAGGGLLVGVRLGDDAWGPAAAGASPGPATAAVFQPNAFVRLDPDDMVTIWVARSDMGQGVRTALPMIVAEEMDADPARVRVEQAKAHPDMYGRMMTVGSGSVRGSAWMPLRRAGASARAVLLAAAAARWNVDAAALRTETGRVVHDASGRSARYGELAAEAAAMPVPDDVALKDPSAFTVIGTSPPPIDDPDKVTGRAGYGIDARPEGLLFGTVVHCPYFTGSLASFDDAPARAVDGVIDVFEVSRGVAVVADNTWAAIQGARALDATWDPGSFTGSSDDIRASLLERARGPAETARDDGDVDAALARSARRVEAHYELPFLAHATMEPMNCTAHVRDDGVEIWAPSQNPQGAQQAAARLLGLETDQVTVNVTLMGCGWGRRSRTGYVEDAVEASRHMRRPVQIVWTREEDMQQDYYRPAMHADAVGGVDASGRVTGLHVRMTGLPINYAAPIRPGLDRNAVDGVADWAYAFDNYRVDNCPSDIPVPTGHWRAVGPTQATFVAESFVDEIAHAAGRDPVEFRRAHLGHEPRMLRVLDTVAERSGWGRPSPPGRAKGVALVHANGSYIAQVAEVGLEDGEVRVHRVWCAADCGQVIHRKIVEGQMSGAIVGGLTAALYGEITIAGGRVEQGNFNSYPMLRMREMPVMDVTLIDSHDAPGGAGEPALPAIAPAVTNALFALTGRRIRTLPIRVDELSTEMGAAGRSARGREAAP